MSSDESNALKRAIFFRNLRDSTNFAKLLDEMAKDDANVNFLSDILEGKIEGGQDKIIKIYIHFKKSNGNDIKKFYIDNFRT